MKGSRKPTVQQRMNRKTSSYCTWCPDPIHSADEATIATFEQNGEERYALVHIECEAGFIEAMQQEA